MVLWKCTKPSRTNTKEVVLFIRGAWNAKVGSQVWCCKEQYCIGTWHVRSMNQGKLEVVKQEMARVNIDILGISEPKLTVMGEFNSDDHYIYYCGHCFCLGSISLYFNKTLLHKSSEQSSLVSGPRLNSSPEAKNPSLFSWFSNNLLPVWPLPIYLDSWT